MNKSLFSSAIDTSNQPYTIISLSFTPAGTTQKPITIKIAPELGSNLFSMMYGNHEIIYSDPSVLAQAGYTGTYVLFPTPNRVTDFTYTWKGKQHTLQKNGQPVTTHHQLVYDQKWSYTQPVIHNDFVSLTTSIAIDKSSDLFAGFPFPCTLCLEYRLYTNRVDIIYSVINNGEEELPFGFGLHPHFARLSGNDKTLVTIPADTYMENFANTMLPNGKLMPVANTPQDVRTAMPAGNLELDHVFTQIQPDRYATVDYTTLQFKVLLKASEDFTHIVVYTGHPDAVCIENQTCSTDAHNLWAKGFTNESHLLTVPAKKSHFGYISYEILPY